jgi:anti-sigma regulatory factor (Ser/Thr protein kinase)
LHVWRNKFAIDLCLEEALSNVIRHGYTGMQDRSVSVRFTMPRESYFEFVIEDEAPHFNPLDAPELPALNAGEDIRIGGQGIRFLREFSDVLE